MKDNMKMAKIPLDLAFLMTKYRYKSYRKLLLINQKYYRYFRERREYFLKQNLKIRYFNDKLWNYYFTQINKLKQINDKKYPNLMEYLILENNINKLTKIKIKDIFDMAVNYDKIEVIEYLQNKLIHSIIIVLF